MPEVKRKRKGLISLDTEDTGIDFAHGARPYFVTICADDGKFQPDFWEWPVDPITRKVGIVKAELLAVLDRIDRAALVVGQNVKFDVKALDAACRDHGIEWAFDWRKARDTLVAGHLLNSAMPHDLTSMLFHFTGQDLQPLEDRLKIEVTQARAKALREHKSWRLARHGLDDMPSVKKSGSKKEEERSWKFDAWLPKLLNPDSTALEDYSNGDSAGALLLWQAQEAELNKLDLMPFFDEGMRVAEVVYRMEKVGIGRSVKRADELEEENRKAAQAAEAECLKVAEKYDYDLKLPKSGNNGSLLTFCFGFVGPKIISGGQTGVDQAALQAAKDAGLKTGGTAPKGWKTLAGPQPQLKGFGLKQSRSDSYAERTWQNVRDAEATLQLYRDPKSPGEICTLKAVAEWQKPLMRVDLRNGAEAQQQPVAEWLKRFSVVNVAGNSNRTCPGIEREALVWLRKTFELSKRRLLDLPVLVRTEAGDPSLNKEAIDQYLGQLDGDRLAFVKALHVKRKRDISLGFLEAYKRFGVPVRPGWTMLYPSANQTATATLRFSCSNPNGQQVSKQEDECERCEGDGCEACHGTGVERTSLRHCFGPLPGREWWCMDFENLELRIPAYEAGEPSMIELFERANEPPYFGSYHLLNASIIYPDLFWPLAEQKGAFKERYGHSWYQWCKNFGFALQYGCGEQTGDRTARRKGSWRAVKAKLAKLEELNQRCIQMANRWGYVETIPDRSMGLKRGYPVVTSRSEWGNISPTVPLNYHVQSTAMWCTRKAMVRCQDQLDQWREREGFDGRMVLQVHDEIVFDFPKGDNRFKAQTLKALMEKSGDDIGIPLKVSAKRHPVSWARGEKAG